jgi:spermidine/putrescine transport system ATP-binding protein
MNTSRATAVEILSVSKSFNAHRALKSVSFKIYDNEFFTLLGPSGCGKTTLLRMIAGFEQPSDGQIVLFGQDIGDLPPHKRRVNTVFQSYALFPHLTLAQNIAFGLENLRWPKERIAARVSEMLRLVHMEEYANRRPQQLSGGQRQRIALARALAPEPKVLLLDEPLSALDLKQRQTMREELRSLQRQTGITFIFVTHDQEEALDMSDRICVLGSGDIQQIGIPSEIYEEPTNRFVADFIGETNFIEVDVRSVQDDTAKVALSGGRELSVPHKGAVQGQRATLSIRPEKITIPAQPDEVSYAGRIASTNYLGSLTHYVVEAEGLRFRISEKNAVSGAQRHAIGSDISFSFAASSARVLGA